MNLERIVQYPIFSGPGSHLMLLKKRLGELLKGKNATQVIEIVMNDSKVRAILKEIDATYAQVNNSDSIPYLGYTNTWIIPLDQIDKNKILMSEYIAFACESILEAGHELRLFSPILNLRGWRDSHAPNGDDIALNQLVDSYGFLTETGAQHGVSDVVIETLPSLYDFRYSAAAISQLDISYGISVVPGNHIQANRWPVYSGRVFGKTPPSPIWYMVEIFHDGYTEPLFIGMNCNNMKSMSGALIDMNIVSAGLNIPIVLAVNGQPNAGEEHTNIYSDKGAVSFGDQARKILLDNPRVKAIKGCCGTNEQYMQEVQKHLKEIHDLRLQAQ